MNIYRVLVITIFTFSLVFLYFSFIGLDKLMIKYAYGQEPSSYMKTNEVEVPPFTMRNASIFCDPDDGLLSGGFEITVPSTNSTFDTLLYSNHPTHMTNSTETNRTQIFEGWTSGLINNASTSSNITTYGLCLNLK